MAPISNIYLNIKYHQEIHQHLQSFTTITENNLLKLIMGNANKKMQK